MKKLANFVLAALAVLAITSTFIVLTALAMTDDLSPAREPPPKAAGIAEGEDGLFDFDRLRDLCRVPWPESIAGERTEEARRKACRSVPL
ncbi:hypothetical protein [Herbaspirillum frisingense]|uniref:Entry exclusion protein TrbK-alt n=1 Tax=Herbaspirillum frisingense TaxID=92645 RepID=A0ABU1PDF0_9BURK|nr:hypothetical protein [Herbaspirillum frisingense]MDR6583785.1 hypothetical protein [Herbaspirillum frisingense]